MRIAFNPARELEQLVRRVASGTPGLGGEFNPEIKPADPRNGDYQANGVLAHAKAAKANPRALAVALLDALKADAEFDAAHISAEIAGPGFINFKLTPAYYAAWLEKYGDESALRTGAAEFYHGKRIVADYPSANTAKQMHVGHLRPLVIGEAVARLIAFCGANLTRDNHIGDWGTNFGTLILAIKRTGYKLDPANDNALQELDDLYKLGSGWLKSNPADADESRAELVKLQNEDPDNFAMWEKIVAVSNAACERIYARFGVKPDVTLGESFYRDKVGLVYDELIKCGLAEISEGALVVWHDEVPRWNRDGGTPFIIRKKDGASNYASTDLATMLYRVEHFGAEECVIFTDSRQQEHFQQLFLTTKKWFEKTGRKLPVMRHVYWGTILGEDGRAIKTKSGESLRLQVLLDEAEERAFAIVSEKSLHLPEEERRAIARTVGISAIRYADLVQNRTIDYTFSWEKLLAFEGNTAPYMLYAVARIRSIFRKLDIQPGEGETGATAPETPQELSLARKLVNFSGAVDAACADLLPHILCTYLYELAGEFSSFYAADKVAVDDPAVRARRLRLCARTCATLEAGLRLLGITPLERM
jgi:arginyl-tRNA synthetase